MSFALSMAVLAENHNLAEDASESSSNQRQVLKIATPSKHRVVTPQSTLNPHLQLRIRLIQEGFSEVDIDRSLEEMWEQDLRYDDFNAVASFIRSRDVVKGSSHTLHPTEEETKTASTAESTTTSKGENQSDGGELNVVKCDKTEDAIDSMGYSVDSDAIQVIRQRKSPAQPLNMSSKLDLVADYENLADSAFALSEWVAKAADRDEIQELCTARKSRALPTVIRRAIAETPDQTKFDDAVLPSMLHLIGSIFLNVGMSSTAASATRKSLESVMQLSRKASLAKVDPEQVFADRISRYIVSRISDAIDDLKSHGNDEGVDLILRLEDEIESLASSLNTGEGGVIELITKRDTNKIAAEKSSAVVGVAMGTTFRGFEMPEEADDASVNKETILVSLVGKSGLDNMKTNKSVYEDLSSRMSELTTSNSDVCARLNDSLETFHAERSLVAERMEELRMAMKQLEEDDAELVQKIADTEAQIAEVDTSRNDEIERLSNQLRETEAVVAYEANIDQLADGLKVYEESLKKAVTVSNIFENCENVNDFVPSKLGVYLVHVKNYLTSESECVDFLRERVKKLEKEARDLKREIEECRALCMSATVSQMSDALSLNRQNISDDKCVIEGLLGEAQNMITNLIGRLDQFVSDDPIQQQKHELSTLHVTLIRGIAGTVEMMGLDDIDRLKAFLPNNNNQFPTVVTTSQDELDELNGSDTDLDTSDEATTGSAVEEGETHLDESVTNEFQKYSKPAESSVVRRGENIKDAASPSDFLPIASTPRTAETNSSARPRSHLDVLVRKLTWASPESRSKRPAVKSLRDIQREELSYRGLGNTDGT